MFSIVSQGRTSNGHTEQRLPDPNFREADIEPPHLPAHAVLAGVPTLFPMKWRRLPPAPGSQGGIVRGVRRQVEPFVKWNTGNCPATA
ncbi:hypothetical protein DPEC_G00291570 [Dallia pectoralis]|uniref:Uncharacterized protein n=1 Tax=Dallia pectoralis TaxID=75939 RepID=A0ACC2FHU7_DALPE|nr:hypothetical protein DPEC_G00291570 [Dallia pectoralis]